MAYEPLQSAFHGQWPAVGADGEVPPALLKRCEQMMRDLDAQFRNPAQTAEGVPWQPDAEDAKLGIRVTSAKATGTKSKRFKCELTVRNCPVQRVFENLVLYERKLQWDTSTVGWGGYIKRYKGPSDAEAIDVEAFTTLPAGGGAISSRLFVDVRYTRWNPDGSIVSTAAAVNDAPGKLDCADAGVREACVLPKVAAVVAKTKGLTIGRNVGGGVLLKPEGRGVHLLMTSLTDIGGWLPTGLVNGATGAAMASVAKGLCGAVLRKDSLQPCVSMLQPPAQGAANGPAAAENDVAAAKPAGERRRRRIREPGCSVPDRWSWRFVAGSALG
eukprot:TRINITY_DN17084_c2_g1_i1.p1 TRINITY_DN17084_c2_g1~~TRINITY_DN17084_c2_g1_i1.p1  ORF type:complete len:329 (+),score=76.35 TRINITY_DN17084_c2_g1_i1:57-1043(+)